MANTPEQSPETILAGRGRNFFFCLPILTAIAMLATNRWFTAVDDECALINTSFHPVSYTIGLFAEGEGQHRHPPLFDIFLHFWLVLTHANFHLLRLPFVLLYVLGAYALAHAAQQIGGSKSEIWVLGMVALWPYGFHYGRVAAWYSFCFAAVCLLTLAYLKFMDRPSAANWAWLVLAILAAVYSNYFCWVLVGCLAFDSWVRRREDSRRWWPVMLGTTLIVVLLYLPILHVFFHVLHKEGIFHFSPISSVAYGIYGLYCTFVSESVGPWFWYLGVPSGLAIALSLCLTLWLSPWPARRFFLYYVAAFSLLIVAGIKEAKELILVGPWLILAIGVTIGTIPAWNRRRALIASILVPGLIGWFGILDRNYYAAPHWVEPWPQIAQESAEVVHNGGIVIGVNPSFFFYLTYDLPADNPPGSGQVWGLLPDSVRHENVFAPYQWLAEGRPLQKKVVLVTGMQFFIPEEPTREARGWLDDTCKLQNDQKLVHDPGAVWKRRFSPETGQMDWRVEVRSYSCP